MLALLNYHHDGDDEDILYFVYVDVVPDLVSIGKPMGNGHPISGVVLPSTVSDRYLRYEAETFKFHQHLVIIESQ